MFNEKNLDLSNADSKMYKDFIDFIDDGNFKAAQIREAYYQLCGISEDKNQDNDVEKILEKMNEISKDNFPLNRFAEIIASKEKYENSVPEYYQYIDSLKIYDKEKKVLKSIVEQERLGEVSCLVDGNVIAEFKIEKGDDVKSLANEMIFYIDKMIRHVPEGKKYNFSFIEN